MTRFYSVLLAATLGIVVIGIPASNFAQIVGTSNTDPMSQKTFAPGRKGVADDSVRTTGPGRKGVADDSVLKAPPLNTGPNTGPNNGPPPGGNGPDPYSRPY